MLLWIEFIILALVIVISGIKLAKYGDMLAEKVRLGRAWIGLILMAGITSLPEFVTGVSAVTVADVPDIAAGDILGACVFNILILGLLDLMDRSSPIFSKVGQSHLLSAGFGVAMLSIISASILLGPVIPSIGRIGIYTPIVIIVYFVGVRAVFFYERRLIREVVAESEKLYAKVSLKRAASLYTLNAVIIVAAASLLPFIADKISARTGLGDSFVGTFFVAMVTTLPELTVSVSSIQRKAYDLAIGNLLGSNMFNLMLLAIDDILFKGGPLLSHISQSHAVTALMAVLMTAIALIGITYRPEAKAVYRFGWDSFAMIAVGLFNMYLLYITRGG